MTAMIHLSTRSSLWFVMMLSFTLAAGCSEKNTNTEPAPQARDCNGIPGGGAEKDECGVCDSDPSNDCLADCAGEYGGTAVEDKCGTCDADSTNDCVEDCNGDWGGSATEDDCGTCDADPSNDCTEDCAGTAEGSAYEDDCGVCDDDASNDNTTCIEDCNGEWGGGATRDNCGVCDDNPDNDNQVTAGGTQAVQDCAGVYCGQALVDDCGECDDDSSNNNTSCAQDCEGTWNGLATEDLCSVCDTNPTNDNTTCRDCAGTINGTAVVDNCGQCGGSNACADCAGVMSGNAVIDDCGVCVGGSTGLISTCDNGCTSNGEYVDLCGDCVGGTTGLSPCVEDCDGQNGGGAITDNCGRCVQGFTGLTACAADCAGSWGGGAFTDTCAGCVGGSTGIPPCTQDCAGVFGGTSSTVQCDGQDVCVDLANTTWFCDPGCTGTMDCAGVCDGPSLLDNCGVCDSDSANDCFRDCNDVFAGAAIKDDCGTCDEDDTNDCRAISFLETPSLIEAVFAETRLYDFRYFEYNQEDFGADEEAPDCDWDDNGNCWVLYMGVNNIADPYNPAELTTIQLNGVPLEVTLSQDGYYLLFAGMTYGLTLGEVAPDLADPYVTMNKTPGSGSDGTVETYVEYKPTLPEGVYSISVAEQNGIVYTLYGNSVHPDAPAENPVSILHIVDISSYPTVTDLGTLQFPSDVQGWDIAVEGTYAYVASGDAGITVIDVSNTSNPELITTAAPSTVDGATHSFETVALGSGFVVGTTGNGGEVFDITTPILPVSTGSFISTYPRDVVIETREIDGEDATILFIADQAAGLSLFELDANENPERRGALALPVGPDDCLDPAGVVCSTTALRLDIREGTAFVSTNLGLFGILLGF